MKDKSISFSTKKSLFVNGKEISFSRPLVMGVLNLTTDSFYSGSRNEDPEKALSRAEKMISDGADIIDTGAVSTRPGAVELPAESELQKLLPVLRELRKRYPGMILSVDTFRAEVAKRALEEGADIINDISGGTFDPGMIPLMSGSRAGFIIMHIQGTPLTMQVDPKYDDVVAEVKNFLFMQARKLKEGGNPNIIIDPGFGFGKTVEHNYTLLKHLDTFHEAGYPVMAGLSRKSMINKVLHTRPEEALNGTTVLNTIALLKGANILRVHDVKEAKEVVALVETYFKV